MTIKLEKLLALDRTRRLLILAGTILFVLVLYFWLFFLPLYREIDRLEGKLAGLMDKKAEQEAIVENLENFKKEYLRLQASLDKAMAQLPNQKEIPSLLENISNVGRECGLELPLFKPDKEVPKDFYAEVPVDIKILGAFGDIVNFFYKVGRLPRIVTISTVEITTPKGKEKELVRQDRLEASCRAITYRFLEPSERAEAAKQEKKPGRGKTPPKGKVEE
jgi:type IV pilus assembly protein PilO